MTTAAPVSDSSRPSTPDPTATRSIDPTAARSIRPTRRVRTPVLAGAVTLLVVTLAGCSNGLTPTGVPNPSSNPSAGPTSGPTPTPIPTTGAGLEHPTGPTDVVFRYEEGGGFVPAEFAATNAPIFTLYGDGTLVFRDPFAAPPETGNNVLLFVPFLTARLDEAGIQAFLDRALNIGGIAIARGPYVGLGADIPTATFTMTVNGTTKTVEVTGLSPDMHPQNQQIVQQLAAFAEFLRSFADQTANEAPYLPPAYRGILIEVEQPFGPVSAWPWEDITPADFKSGVNDVFKTARLTPEQVQMLDIDGVEGGMTGVTVQSDGKLYTLSLRPLLPDETE